VNFAALKEFRKNPSSGIKDVIDYLSIELSATIRELRVGLQKISFADNFDSFESVITIPANSEVEILNSLNSIPTYYLILSADKGGLSVCKGDTGWTLSRIYMKNVSLTDAANITVRFFR
jgi:hypothetical protein